MAPRVAVHVLTHDSRPFLEPCLSGLQSQSRPPDRLLFIDCASRDGTADWLRARAGRDLGVRLLDENRGYAGGHNAGLADCDSDYVLLLNPDVRLGPRYIEACLRALESAPGAGAATGKLLRGDSRLRPLPGPVLDSTGMVMTRSQRHLDRGAGELDDGRFEAPEEVFGVSGAAPLYRRAMLADVAVDGEILDESFFAYREDADLAWRARLLGWSALYVPEAVAVHRRRVRPECRRSLPAALNRHSVRNRFLLRLKNQTASNLRRTWWPGLVRDAEVIGYVLLREWSSVPGLVQVVGRMGEARRKRRVIMARRRASGPEVDRWFGAGGTPAGGGA